MNDLRKIWLERDLALTARVVLLVRRRFARALALGLTHSGDSPVWLLLGVLLWRFGVRNWAVAGERILLVSALTWVISVVLKFSIRRPRPEGEPGLLYLKIDPHSFPSGHATRAGGLWVALVGLLPFWGKLLLLLWSLGVGVSRVALGVHYASDAIVGWLVGAGVGLALLAFL
jgi:undecaprenyl-diphosphatase